MRQIIEGKKYDTETATLVYRETHGMAGDLERYEEELYRKRTGEYFLFGRGGPASPYSRRASDGSFTGNACIVRLTDGQARAWMERNSTVADYEAEFGVVEE